MRRETQQTFPHSKRTYRFLFATRIFSNNFFGNSNQVDILFNICSRPLVYIFTNKSEKVRYNKMALRFISTPVCV